ncbi:MAG: hypothetical protein ABIT96_10845 [Ferruginibacter sp.]
MSYFPDLAQALASLIRDGYNLTFIKKDAYIHCPERQMNFLPHELFIDEVYRFENKFAPQENTVVYIIEEKNYGLKGILRN